MCDWKERYIYIYIYIDLSDEYFSRGQIFVALSRNIIIKM